MVPGLQAEPLLEWSHTRSRTLRECARRYFYRYHGARGGWSPRAPVDARRAYQLSQLTTLDLVLGTTIHRCAAESARAIIARRSRPDVETFRKNVRQALNMVWRNARTPDAFFADPRRHPVLLGVYYGRGVGEASIQRIREKMDRCLVHLVEAPVWADLLACEPASVHVVDSPDAVALGDVSLWAAPDLVYTTPDGRTILLDWKTGPTAPEEAQAQLSLYAAYAEAALGLSPGPLAFEGQVWDLSSGEVCVLPLGAPEIRAASVRLESESAEVRTRLARVEAVGVAEAFPLTSERFRCSRCNFWELCEPELRHRTSRPR